MKKISISLITIVVLSFLTACGVDQISIDTSSIPDDTSAINSILDPGAINENPNCYIDSSSGALIETPISTGVSHIRSCKPGDALEYTLSADAGYPIIATYDADQNLIATVLAVGRFDHQTGIYVFSESEVYFRIAGISARTAGYHIKYVFTETLEIECLYNPYSDVNWDSVQKICSVSHQHGVYDATVQNLYDRGVRHIAMSNYYPSKPYYPMSEFYTGTYEGLLMSPNAEHHNLGGLRQNGKKMTGSFHINSLGSMFESGNPLDVEPKGYGDQGWTNAFAEIIAGMQYPDAGGITINHPVWSQGTLDTDDILAMLDYSPRVLGIEIYNQSCEEQNQTGWALELWDQILQTGRRCWGFCVADHGGESSYAHPTPEFSGRNILLVDSFTEYDCLKAYADGRFYGKLNETDFHFDKIEYSNGKFSVSAPGAEYINIIIDGVYTKYEATSVSISIPYKSVYIRAEAHRSNDSLFSNPIIFRDNKD